eukprot:1290251-Pleurochrysis_carterae.AAC.4
MQLTTISIALRLLYCSSLPLRMIPARQRMSQPSKTRSRGQNTPSTLSSPSAPTSRRLTTSLSSCAYLPLPPGSRERRKRAIGAAATASTASRRGKECAKAKFFPSASHRYPGCATST